MDVKSVQALGWQSLISHNAKAPRLNRAMRAKKPSP